MSAIKIGKWMIGKLARFMVHGITHNHNDTKQPNTMRMKNEKRENTYNKQNDPKIKLDQTNLIEK